MRSQVDPPLFQHQASHVFIIKWKNYEFVQVRMFVNLLQYL